MAGLLDLLFGGGQPQPQYPWQQQSQPPQGLLGGLLGGMGERKGQMMGYLSGALMPGSTQEQIARGLQGAVAGGQNDILQQTRLDALRQHREQERSRAGVANDLPVSDPMKRLMASDPKSMEAFVQKFFNPTVQNNGQTTLSVDAFGNPKPLYREPNKPEKVSEYDPATGRTKEDFKLPPDPTGTQGVLTGPYARQLSGKPVQQMTENIVSAVPQGPGPNQGINIAPNRPANGGWFSAPSAAEKEEGQEIGKGLGNDYTKLQKDAAAATRSLATYQRMTQLNADPRLWQGAAAPAVTHAKSLLASFGIDPKSVAPGEEFNALANRAVLDSMNGSLGPGVSNNDVKFMAQSLPSLAHTAEGRREMVETLSAVAKRQQETARMATAYRKRVGTLDGFTDYAAQWADKNPLFEGRAAPTAPAATGAPSRSDLEAEMRRRGLLK